MSTTGCCMGLSAKDCWAFGKCGEQQERDKPSRKKPQRKRTQPRSAEKES